MGGRERVRPHFLADVDRNAQNSHAQSDQPQQERRAWGWRGQWWVVRRVPAAMDEARERGGCGGGVPRGSAGCVLQGCQKTTVPLFFSPHFFARTFRRAEQIFRRFVSQGKRTSGRGPGPSIHIGHECVQHARSYCSLVVAQQYRSAAFQLYIRVHA